MYNYQKIIRPTILSQLFWMPGWVKSSSKFKGLEYFITFTRHFCRSVRLFVINIESVKRRFRGKSEISRYYYCARVASLQPALVIIGIFLSHIKQIWSHINTSHHSPHTFFAVKSLHKNTKHIWVLFSRNGILSACPVLCQQIFHQAKAFWD